MTSETITDVAQIDREDMLGAIQSIPGQLRSGFATADGFRTQLARAPQIVGDDGQRRTFRSLIICGMGGSGVGGDLLGAAADLRIPVIPVKGYELPPWAGAGDIMVCVSYSGETAETLACYEAARQRVPVAAVITSGGRLAELAAADGVTVIPVPAGLQPRAAVGVLFGSLAAVCGVLGVLDDADQMIDAAAVGANNATRIHDTARSGAIQPDEDDETVEAAPHALDYARALADSVVVVYGAGPSAVVAQRWKAQINENGKLPAFANAYPELDHNEIVGWQRAAATQARFTVVELVMPGTSERVLARFDATRELISDDVATVLRIEPEATNRAGAVFELVAWGDYLSVYLALLAGIDPTPVERIQNLKRRLSGR